MDSPLCAYINYNTTYQLDAGVRLVSGQVHKSDSEWHLCHTKCELLDAGKLSTWLGHIKDWLDQNPNDGTLDICLGDVGI